jgi:class 3 adenylate cyclase
VSEAGTVLFADISDSTRLYETLGTETTRLALMRCLAVMAAAVTRGGGTVVDQIGDELMCTFPDVESGARAAGELHRAVERANADSPAALRIRIGFHHGPLLVEAGRVFGETVHVARRIASLAKPQQTLTSRDCNDALSPAAGIATRFVDRTHLKGKDEHFEIYEVLWDVAAATIAVEDLGAATRRVEPIRELILRSGARTYVLDSIHPRLTIGRDARADVVERSDRGVHALRRRLDLGPGQRADVEVDDAERRERVETLRWHQPELIHERAGDLVLEVRLGARGAAQPDAGEPVSERLGPVSGEVLLDRGPGEFEEVDPIVGVAYDARQNALEAVRNGELDVLRGRVPHRHPDRRLGDQSRLVEEALVAQHVAICGLGGLEEELRPAIDVHRLALPFGVAAAGVAADRVVLVEDRDVELVRSKLLELVRGEHAGGAGADHDDLGSGGGGQGGAPLPC